jgi:phage FluMu gp28-like protein
VSEPNLKSYFLPYQIDWIKDPSRFKIWEKSRRIGATYAQSYEDVLDAARDENPMDVWFTSADESAAKEYILYCGQWARLFHLAAEDLGEIVLDKQNDIKALVVEFANGKRIHGLSSNPTAFRSKGGKLVVDEYAFHKQPEELWKAAQPIVLWGFPIRVLSTYNGKGNRYYRMVSEAKQGNRWSLHTTTLMDAVGQGLVSKIIGHAASEAEIEAFIADARATAGDEENWLQEFMCQPVDEATAWLTWDLITSGEHKDAGKPELYQGGDCYVGMDIARRRHLTIIWVDEKIGDVLVTREVVRMKNATFAAQDAELDRVFEQYKVRRCCMDQTGIGEKPVEDAKKRHGEYRVEGVLFTGPVKQHLAQGLKQRYEDRKVRTPEDKDIRAAHHAVRKTTTIAGNPRFDADQTELGHADEFWAHGLAVHAAEETQQPAAGSTVEPEADHMVPEAMRGRRRLEMHGRAGMGRVRPQRSL